MKNSLNGCSYSVPWDYILSLVDELGYNDKWLSEQVGVSRRAIYRYRNGSVPDAKVVARIADAIDVSMDDLFKRGVKPSKIKTRITKTGEIPWIEIENLMGMRSHNYAWLADEIGIQKGQCYKYRNGQNPNIYIAIKLADVLNLSLDEIFGREKFIVREKEYLM